jgi:hypothetical protein
MKTIIKKGEILRVSESEADLKVKSGWSYTSKLEWKTKVRDLNKETKK